MFKRTTAVNKILKLVRRIRGIQGGTSAGKTIAQLMIEIDYAAKHPNTETSVVAESVPHLKRGAMKDFKKIMRVTGRWNPDRWNKTDSIYHFHNGSYIEFFSVKDDDKLRGARRTRLYMNEANNMRFKAYTQLASRTSGTITLDWNPSSRFWFHDELQGDEDVDFLVLTSEDNEGCPQSALDFILKAKGKSFKNPDLPKEILFNESNIKSHFWSNWYRVYGLGLIGSLEGVVFENYKKVDSIPKEARLLAYGMDFGFTNDPTTLIAVYLLGDKVLLHEVFYEKGLSSSQIAKRIKQAYKEYGKSTIYADNSEPREIKEIKTYGIDIRGEKKESINYGIELLQQREILITKSSKNLITEFENYIWFVDKEGNKTNKPIDGWNHGIDGVRYVAVSKLNNRKRFIRAKAG